MNRTLKIVLLSIGALIVALIILFVAGNWKYIKATRQLHAADTQEINDSVFCVKDGYVNAFLFKTPTGYLMIDGGMREGKVLKEMKSFGIEAGDVHTLLLTHSDRDHIGVTGALENAAVWMHREEEQMVTGETEKMGSSYTWKYGDYKLFDSDQVLDIDGLKVRIIHTPGHTPGSCCFAINDTYLVTGDNLMMDDNKYAPFVEAFTMDPPLNAESIKNLPDPSEYEFVLTGHGGIIDLN